MKRAFRNQMKEVFVSLTAHWMHDNPPPPKKEKMKGGTFFLNIAHVATRP